LGGEPDTANDKIEPLNRISRGGLGLTYAHLLNATESWGGIRRGRWYVQADTGPLELYRHGRIGGHPDHVSLTIGVRIESKTLGFIDLYATGTRVWPRPYVIYQ
jgi:hypothetical protein